MLREVVRDHAKARGGWFGVADQAAGPQAGFRAAQRAGEHRKVLEDGEELLMRLPGDLPTQMEMADSGRGAGAARRWRCGCWRRRGAGRPKDLGRAAAAGGRVRAAEEVQAGDRDAGRR